MSAPVATSQETVLQAVVDKLITDLADLGINAETCFIASEPELLEPNSSASLFITVCPMDAQFQEETLIGAGQYACVENAGVVISPHSARKLDRVERAEYVLTEETKGLLAIKRRILKSLTGQQLEESLPLGGYNLLLVNLMHPMHASRPRYNDKTGLTWFSVTFSTDFQWDLQT